MWANSVLSARQSLPTDLPQGVSDATGLAKSRAVFLLPLPTRAGPTRRGKRCLVQDGKGVGSSAPTLASLTLPNRLRPSGARWANEADGENATCQILLHCVAREASGEVAPMETTATDATSGLEQSCLSRLFSYLNIAPIGSYKQNPVAT